MSDVVDWARRVGRAQLRHDRVEFDRVSLDREPEYREEVRRLSDEISREMRAEAQARLGAKLEQQPLLRAMLDPHGSAVILQYLVVFIAAAGGTIFLTRSGVDFSIGATISAVLCLIAALLMTAVVLRERNRGPMPRFTTVVTILVAASTVPGLGLAVATQTLTDPEYAVRWAVLASSAVIALVLLVVIARTRRAIGADGRARLAAELDEWAAEVRATHDAALRDAAGRLAGLWASVPLERRAAVEGERDAAVDVLSERGLAEHAEALRGAVPGALELDAVIAITGGWGAGSKALTTGTLVPVPVVDDRPAAAG